MKNKIELSRVYKVKNTVFLIAYDDGVGTQELLSKTFTSEKWAELYLASEEYRLLGLCCLSPRVVAFVPKTT